MNKIQDTILFQVKELGNTATLIGMKQVMYKTTRPEFSTTLGKIARLLNEAHISLMKDMHAALETKKMSFRDKISAITLPTGKYLEPFQEASKMAGAVNCSSYDRELREILDRIAPLYEYFRGYSRKKPVEIEKLRVINPTAIRFLEGHLEEEM